MGDVIGRVTHVMNTTSTVMALSVRRHASIAAVTVVGGAALATSEYGVNTVDGSQQKMLRYDLASARCCQ